MIAGADSQRQTIISGGLAWVTRATQAALSLGAVVVLARLLSPEAFGIFAMVVPLGAIANQLAGHCFQTALLQHRGLTAGELGAFFRFALRTNFAIAALMVVGGLLLGWFYEEPRVRAITVAWAAATFALTLTTFQEAMLKRELRFPVVLGAQFAGLVAGITCAIIAALRGLGYWALPVQLLVMEATRAVGVAAASRWLPPQPDETRVASFAALRRAWWSLAGFRLASWINDQPELLAVGRMGGAFTLGLYDTARRWAWYPFEEPYVILTDVTVAGVNAAGSDPAITRRVLCLTIMAALAASLPLIGFVGVAADDVVSTFLGADWSGAVPYLRVLCVMAAAGAIVRVMYWVPLARGAPEVLLRWSILVQLPATLAAVLTGQRWGPLGVAVAMSAAWCALLVPCLFFVLRDSPVRPADFVGAVWRPVLATAGAVTVVLAWRMATSIEPGAGRLLVGLGVYLVSVVAAWLVIPGGWSLLRAFAFSFRQSSSSI